MKSWMLIVGIVGLGLGWGWYGAQQAHKREYNCQVRAGTLCFLWEKSQLGDAQDPVNDRVKSAVGTTPQE